MDSPIPRPSPPSHASFEERLRPLEWSKRRKIARFRPESRMKALVLDTRVPTETTKHKTKIFQYATAAYMPGPFSSSPDVYSGWVHYWPCARQCVMLRCDGGEWKLATGPLESIPSPLKGDVPLKRAPEYLKSLYRCFDVGTMPRPWVFFFFIDTRCTVEDLWNVEEEIVLMRLIWGMMVERGWERFRVIVIVYLFMENYSILIEDNYESST